MLLHADAFSLLDALRLHFIQANVAHIQVLATRRTEVHAVRWGRRLEFARCSLQQVSSCSPSLLLSPCNTLLASLTLSPLALALPLPDQHPPRPPGHHGSVQGPGRP